MDYMLRKQHKVDEYHNDMPLIYYVEGHCLHFVRPEFALITGMRFGTIRFCSYTSVDLQFRNRVFPHKVGLVVTILDVLGVIENEVMFGNLCAKTQLVENLEAWIVFPWGEHVWTYLYDSIKNVVAKHSDTHYLGLKKDRKFGFSSLLKEVIVGGLMPLKLYQEQLGGLKSSYSKDLIESRTTTDIRPTRAEYESSWWIHSNVFFSTTRSQAFSNRTSPPFSSLSFKVGEVTQTSCFKFQRKF
ncbi:hypothetical protein Tco_1436817 [Tanacetum coccineum]